MTPQAPGCISRGFRREAHDLIIVGLVLLFLPQPLRGQDTPEADTTDSRAKAPAAEESSERGQSDAAPSPSETPLKGPKYNALRYNDDFSYLDGPEGSYEKDFFDPLKWIHLTDDLTLSIGGDLRGRWEGVTYKRYGAEDPHQDSFFLHRYHLYTDVKYRNAARFFFQGASAFAEDVDGTPIPLQSDRNDIQQMFIDLRVLGENVPLTFRVGRQEMLYGKQRLISPLGWANVQRSWDGAKLFWEGEDWNIDVWYVKPVEKRERDVDNVDWDQDFYGLYTTYKGIDRHGIDAYFLALRNDGDVRNANLYANDTGDLSVYTLGSRFFGSTPVGAHVWDYDTELSGQWGSMAGDTIHAWAWAIESGYTFKDWPWSPRVGAGFDWATGDNNPFDQSHDTFNQLFPLGHAYLGWLDQVGRQNIMATNVNLTLQPYEALLAKIYWHRFWLDEPRDALYNAGGAPVRRRPGRPVVDEDVGNELDIRLDWKLDRHATFTVGYSHLWTGEFLERTGMSEDPDLFYIMYNYRF